MTFSPDELASGLGTLQRAGKVEGVFLSSGIITGSVTAQDKILDIAELVRHLYGNRDYLHLLLRNSIAGWKPTLDEDVIVS